LILKSFDVTNGTIFHIFPVCSSDGGGRLTTLYCPRTLVGIVSWEWDCGYSDYPAVFTKVSGVPNARIYCPDNTKGNN
jgi:hypothetical protein